MLRFVLVKLIATFLVLQLLLASIVPCVDSDACENDNVVAAAIAIHNHLPTEQDNCSPFCISSCCTPHFASHAAEITGLLATSNHIELLTPYADRFLPERMKNIWQPPRLI